MGKTIQLISLIVTNRPQQSKTLIICPGSVVNQWYRELTTKTTKKAKLKVLRFHGPDRSTDVQTLGQYDVIITTYALVLRHAAPVPQK